MLYERVPLRRKAAMAALSAPVISQMSFSNDVSTTHNITNLPRGRYVVCGEASSEGVVYRAGCSHIVVERVRSNSKREYDPWRQPDIVFVGLPGGVRVLIMISMVLLCMLFFYSFIYQLCKRTLDSRPVIKPL